MVSLEVLTGKTREHLVPLPETSLLLHKEALAPFQELQERAKKAGFALTIASAFRDYETQLRIWNEKVSGKRAVLDSSGGRLELNNLDPEEQVHAILRWSALPGASRHHWGTDFDVFDAKALGPGQKVELTPQEVNEGGPFFALHEWLDKAMDPAVFFRPYEEDSGGVAPERWHLSYRPVSDVFSQAFTVETLRSVVGASDMALKEVVLRLADEIFARYNTHEARAGSEPGRTEV